MIPREKIDEIISRIDIGALIGRYVTLKPAGKSLKGLCPFHTEKTPSFNVHPDRGFFKCFGCGAGGGAIQFLMKIEGIDYGEAVRILADQAGVAISTSPAEKRALTERDVLRKLLKAAVLFYQETLTKSPLGKDARAYLVGRGIDMKTVSSYNLGYAPEGGEFLAGHLRGRHFEYEVMERAGLVRRGNRDFYDYFRGRIIYPIADSQGRFIGMGGRGMTPDATPKYLNTPQSPIFSKGSVLYGLHLARNAIRGAEEAFVVEGYMDAISLHGAGIENVIASMGTALTEEQAKGIARYTSRVIFAYDADAAGEAATVRGIEIFEKAGLHVRIMELPKGEDPDSIIQKKGAEYFRKLSTKARSIIEYKIEFLNNSLDLSTPEGKEQFVAEVTPIIKEIRGKIRQSEYIRHLTEKYRIPEELFRKTFADKRTRRQGMDISPVLKKIPTKPEEILLAYLFSYPKLIKRCTELEQEPQYHYDEQVIDPDLLYIYRNLQNIDLENAEVIGVEILNGIVRDDEMLQKAVDLSMVEGLPPGNEEEVRAILHELRIRSLKRRNAELQSLVSAGIADGSITGEHPYFIELMDVKRELKGAGGQEQLTS